MASPITEQVLLRISGVTLASAIYDSVIHKDKDNVHD